MTSIDDKDLWRTGQDQSHPGTCPKCGLPWEPTPTDGHDWVMLEPDFEPAAHVVPPRQRWVIRRGRAVQDDGCPNQGQQCRVAHSLTCPDQNLPDLWPWLTTLRKENHRKAQRLF